MGYTEQEVAEMVEKARVANIIDKIENAWCVVPWGCPKCDSAVVRYMTCHTYQNGCDSDGNALWVACYGCNSAEEYSCASETCDWVYTYGLNPLNPRSAANEANRPDWLEKLETSLLGDPVFDTSHKVRRVLPLKRVLYPKFEVRDEER